jgi:hypothetical protein
VRTGTCCKGGRTDKEGRKEGRKEGMNERTNENGRKEEGINEMEVRKK